MTTEIHLCSPVPHRHRNVWRVAQGDRRHPAGRNRAQGNPRDAVAVETFVTHGEPAAADAMRGRIQENLGWTCRTPDQGEVVELADA